MSEPAAEQASGYDSVSPTEGRWLKHYDPFVPQTSPSPMLRSSPF
jgi:hypothetical protein